MAQLGIIVAALAVMAELEIILADRMVMSYKHE